MKIETTKKIIKTYNIAILTDGKNNISNISFSEKEKNFIKKSTKNNKKIIEINQFDRFIYIIIIDKDKTNYKTKEKARKAAYNLLKKIDENKLKNLLIYNKTFAQDINLAFIEGLLMSNYSFNKYFTKNLAEKDKTLESIKILDEQITTKDLIKIKTIVDSVFIARNLVNEPFSSLNSVELSDKLIELSKEAGFKIEVLYKKQIQALKMGGLLTVNKASKIPPTFSILEWKPEKARNKKPIILVGKGIVFDTGGYNLKPGEYMNDMKSDMGGAAAVAGTIYAISKLKIPVHVIGLIPSTDNLIGKDAYVTGDIITMHNGMTVEIKNTDAEGRLILADALSYAQKYSPELVIDMATLTGAAVRAVGDLASAMLSNAEKKTKKALLKSGNETYERLIEFPLWEEYAESLKSQIADIKNLGAIAAGHITAAKFLEYFTQYRWIHLDIASTAFLDKKNDYRGEGGTGIPVRLLVNFIENYI